METDLKSTAVSKWTKIKKKIKIVLFLFITLIVIITAVFSYWKYFYTYSDGYRAGLLQKFSYKGNIFKTYEGEMILGGVSSNLVVALNPEKFYFSVTNEKLAKQLDTMQGQMVMVHYHQKNGVLFWQGDTENLVDSVKRIR